MSGSTKFRKRYFCFESLEDRCLLAVVMVDTALDVVNFDDDVTSLREAIFATNIVPGPDEIVFDFGHDGPATILLEYGEMVITDPLAITGDGPELLTIDAQEESRIFNITTETGDFMFARMTLTRGKTSGSNALDENTFSGGAIRSLTTGDLTIEDCVVIGNSTTGEVTAGGGIFAHGDVTVTSSTISDNRGGDFGGGIAGGNVTVTSSTISGNRGDEGGGIAGGNVTVTSSTISDNNTDFSGGGIYAGGNVTVTSSTISDNLACEALGWGGGIYAGGNVTVTSSTISDHLCSGIYADGNVMVTIKNSIVAGNRDGPRPDLWPGTGTLSIEYSLIGDNTGTGMTEAPVGSPDANGNLIGGPAGGVINPLLGPLADNGGPTQTHTLLPGSPAINAGDPSAVAGVGGVSLYDQRGEGFDRVVGSRIDMGAFEVQVNADFDEDGDVDGNDFLAWQVGFGIPNGANLEDGDADGDGDVDGNDFLIWQQNFGSGSGSGSAAALFDQVRATRERTVDRVFDEFARRSMITRETIVDAGDPLDELVAGKLRRDRHRLRAWAGVR